MKQNILNRKNMPDIIAEELREAILNGELKGGDQLKQEEIAGIFNSSLIPVREALRRLEAQGLVKISPNRGAYVSMLSANEVKELFEIRILLEKGAIEFAIENLSEKDIQTARPILNSLDIETEGSRMSSLNWEFHNTLYRACNRAMLLEMIHNLHVNVERYMRLYLVDMDYHPTSQSEHYKLLDACGERDAEAAKSILEKHMKKACATLIKFLSDKEDTDG